MADTLWIRFCRGLNYFTAFLVVAYYSAAILVTIFECTPVDKMWYPDKPGTCINKAAFFYATGTVNVTTSLLVISTPLPVLFRTQHRRAETNQVLGLILLGLIDTATSVVRMFTLASAAASKADFTCERISLHRFHLHANFPTGTIINGVTATSIEMSLAIIAASLVVMRPCFKAIYRKLFPNSHMHSTLSGYSPSGNLSSAHSNNGREGRSVITKTVEFEMAVRSISTEDILRSQD